MTEELASLDAIRKSEYYSDWGKNNHCAHALGGDIRVTPDILLTFKLNRGNFGRPFSERDRHIVQLLMPHLKRAISLYNRLNVLEERAWILEGLTYPMIYVASSGVVRWANGAASNLLRREKGLRLRDGKLRAKNIADNTCLQKLLREGRTFEEGQVDGYGGWLRIADDDTELSLFFTRPPHRIRRSLGLPEASSGFLIFVATQTIDIPTLTTRVRSAWGLTLAEAALAVELLEANGIQSAADKLKISRNTAKVQLAWVFQKTGVRRQSELVKKVLSLAVVGAPPVP